MVDFPGDIANNYWRDGDGNVLACQAGGTDEFTESLQRPGRDDLRVVGYDGAGGGSPITSYAEAGAVTTNDTIIEQTDYTYDAAGDVTMEADHRRPGRRARAVRHAKARWRPYLADLLHRLLV